MQYCRAPPAVVLWVYPTYDCRLEMLENQCNLWPDPISAVVYVPTLKGKIFSDDSSLNGSHLGVALERLADFHQRMELSGWPIVEATRSKT